MEEKSGEFCVESNGDSNFFGRADLGRSVLRPYRVEREPRTRSSASLEGWDSTLLLRSLASLAMTRVEGRSRKSVLD